MSAAKRYEVQLSVATADGKPVMSVDIGGITMEEARRAVLILLEDVPAQESSEAKTTNQNLPPRGP